MKKIILSFFLLSLNMLAMAAEPGTDWFPLAAQNSMWTVTGTGAAQKLNYDGTPIAGTAIATNFGGLTPPYTGMSVKFRTTVSTDAAQSTVIVLGSNAAWGGQGIVLDITKDRIFACKNFAYFDNASNLIAVKLSSNEAAYQAAISTGVTPYTFIIDVNATGLITVTVNGVVCATSYQVDPDGLNLLNTNTFILFAPSFTGYKLRDVVAKRGGVAKSYFPTIIYTIAASSNDVAKGSVTGSGDYQTTSDVSLIATPTTGNKFVNWTEGGVEISTSATLPTFSATVARTLVANFAADGATSINQKVENSFKVFPSQSTGLFTINSDVVGNQYSIVNTVGQQISKGFIKATSQQLDLTAQQKGTYLLVVEGVNGKIVRKIVKE